MKVDRLGYNIYDSASRMTQTEALIQAKLPRDLSAIVLGYFRASLRSIHDVAQAGEYEECALFVDLWPNTCFHWACIGGHVEIARLAILHGAWPLKRDLEAARSFGHSPMASFVLRCMTINRLGWSLIDTLKDEGQGI